MNKIALACAAATLVLPGLALAAPSTPDFLAKAGATDKFEVAAGKLAETHGGSAAVKHFGRKMVADHTKSTHMVEHAAMTSDVHAPAPALTDDQKAMIADLQGKRGKAFDTAYIADQKTAHQQALSLMQDYAQNGDDPKLKAAAAKIVPVVQEHIDMLNKMSE
jgi:putative membrane protein